MTRIKRVWPAVLVGACSAVFFVLALVVSVEVIGGEWTCSALAGVGAWAVMGWLVRGMASAASRAGFKLD